MNKHKLSKKLILSLGQGPKTQTRKVCNFIWIFIKAFFKQIYYEFRLSFNMVPDGAFQKTGYSEKHYFFPLIIYLFLFKN